MVVRMPAVAGRFYPRQPGELAQTVRSLLAEQDASIPGHEPFPNLKGLIVPHAGYVYSGSLAAHAYSLLLPFRDRIRRVVLIGPSHYVSFPGIGITSASAFETPLGTIPIDEVSRTLEERFDFVSIRDDAHAPEHSLEVQLPFLKIVLNDFHLVPLVYGRVSPQQVAEVLNDLWGGPETLILISSDLSHFLDEATCRGTDAGTARIIENLAVSNLSTERACGAVGIQGLMLVARERGLKISTLALKNSAEASGDFDRVVGYGGFVLFEDDQKMLPRQTVSSLHVSQGSAE